MRGKGIRNKSCCIEPIEIAGALTAKHCGDSTSDCSNGVLIYPAKVVKPYGSTGGICGVKLGENKKDLSSPVCSRDYKGILRNDGDAIVEVRAVLTPDREEKRQNGRRMKDEGEPMFTLTAQDGHGVAIIDDQGRANKKLTPSDICPTLRAQSHGNEPKVVIAYDEQNNTLRTDGTVGMLTTDGSSPKHNNRVIVGGEQREDTQTNAA